MKFLHLRVHSSYTLAKSMLKIEDIIKLTKRHNMPAIGICDDGNMFGSLEYSLYASQNGIKPIIGCNLRIVFPDTNDLDEINIFAKNKIGYDNLLKLVSYSYLKRSSASYLPNITYNLLTEYNEGLIILSGAGRGTLARYLLGNNIQQAKEYVTYMKNIFGNRFYIELIRQDFEADYQIEDQAIDIAYKFNIPIVATNPVLYPDTSDYEAHDTLVCIANNEYIDDENRVKKYQESYFKSSETMAEIFSDLPEALQNTYNIAIRCSAIAETRSPMLPSFVSDSSISEDELFKTLAREGLRKRINNKITEDNLSEVQIIEMKDQYYKRLDYEVNIISQMKFAGYFLIVSDFIKWSKANNIPVGPGRGSGAGSLVAWSLEITDLDPIRFGLLFERFLNPERISMPDFDIDFCQERREEVISYVRHKYGTEKVAQIVTFSKLQARAVIRDVGRILQLPNPVVDRISKMIPHNPVNPVNLVQARELEPELDKAIKGDAKIEKMYELALKLEGLYRQTSTHAAGVVIADQDLINLVPLYIIDSKIDNKRLQSDAGDESSEFASNMPVIQYNMKDAEKAGLVKFDFLGLKTLTVISQTIGLLKKQGIEINFDNINLDDLNTYQLLSTGESNGIFQFESQGMQETLKRLKPDTIEDIIALGALYRPGPMDNIPTYIARKHKLETPDYYHPSLEEVLKETYGVIIYQEQVMQIAQILAGYSLGSADLLRRAMGKKIKAEMDAQRDMFVDGSVKNGLSSTFADQMFDLVAKFAGYGFNKSHAAAYGIISYQTAYLKANYIVEFLIATLNLDIMDTDKVALFINEAKKFGIEVLPPCINNSSSAFSLEISNGKKAIRYGLHAIKNVGENLSIYIAENRKENGLYNDLADFYQRNETLLNKRSLENLIKAGAFDILNNIRKDLFEDIEKIVKNKSNNSNKFAASNNQISLFANLEMIQNEVELDYTKTTIDWPIQQKLDFEYEVLGFYLSNHPMKDCLELMKQFSIKSYKDIINDLSDKDKIYSIAAVGIDYRIKASQKGRFAIIYASDLNNNFTLTVYKKELIDEKRNIITSRRPLYLKVSARKDDGIIKIFLEDVDLLDNFFITHSNSLKIKTDKIDIIDYLSQFNSNDVLDIIFETKIGNYNIGMSLGKKHPTPAQIEQIRALYPETELEFS